MTAGRALRRSKPDRIPSRGRQTHLFDEGLS